MAYPYYSAAPQPAYHFLGLPPTPAHTGSTNSDDFNTSSPVRDPATLHLNLYDNPSHSFLTTKQDPFDQYQQFDYSNFTNNGLPQPEPPTPQIKPTASSASNGSDPNMEFTDEANRRGSNSDDDDNMTPAQSRRKAQNRAAQRAFRERKERHVKDLEAKLALLEKNSANVAEENQRLKLQLQKAATENEILKATSGNRQHGNSEPLPRHGPMRYSPNDFYHEVLTDHENKTPSHRIVTSEAGQKLYGVGAAWDYIIKHPLYARGLVDVGDVSDRLKRHAQCDGQGPVFEERILIEAIEQSIASGTDELL